MEINSELNRRLEFVEERDGKLVYGGGDGTALVLPRSDEGKAPAFVWVSISPGLATFTIKTLEECSRLRGEP